MLSSVLNNLLPDVIKERLAKYKRANELTKWENTGKPIPVPHVVKQRMIAKYKDKTGFSVFIETGTYMGDMIWAQRNNFTNLYSIELGIDLWKAACNRFKNFDHIEIIQGDSGKVLTSLISKLNNGAIFWLDGHYSAGITAKGELECPIYGELDAIRNSPLNHILLIDDARLFVGKHDYPTIQELSDYIMKYWSKSKIEIADDIICVELKR